MPSVNKTENLGLNLWQGNEYVKREDFVEDNKKIDEAIVKKAEVIITDKDISINERRKGAFYFIITDKEKITNNNINLKVNPSMGIKIL